MYTNQSKVESYLKRALTDDEVELLDETIDYISQQIDSYTGRSWLPYEYDGEALEATARIFDGNGQREIYVDDFTDLESVRLLDSDGETASEYTSDSDFITYPLNSTTKSSIRLRTAGFGLGSARVEITAIWGSGDVPSGIVMVATAMVGNYLASTGDSSGQYKKETIEGWSYELLDGTVTDEQTQALLTTLDKWKKYTL